MLPRSGFLVVDEGNTDPSRAWTARKKSAYFPGHTNPPARSRAHKPHTIAAEINIYGGLEWVLLMGEVSGQGRECSSEVGRGQMRRPRLRSSGAGT